MDNSVLIVGDPLEGLKFDSDSSLAMAEGALGLGCQAFWTTAENIGLLNGVPVVSELFEIKKVNSSALPEIEKKLIAGTPKPLGQFRKIFIRKDPPFDQSYMDLCWILSQCRAEQVINNPLSLLSHHEKLTPWQLVREGVIPEYMSVPTLVSRDPRELLQFAEQQFETAELFLKQFAALEVFKDFRFRMLCKPWRGHGGRGIVTFLSPADVQKWIRQMPVNRNSLLELFIFQPLLPEISTKGDRRVFAINGRVFFDFVRFPAAGKIEANLAQGGSAILDKMSADLFASATKIAIYLKQKGILIAGMDFIGDRLTEVNVTSPTGIRTYENLTATKCSAALMTELLKTADSGDEI
ncbi:MAG: hypothetical protein EBR09_05695 [Proteobacteria bacterium]|nr:hypothetical protein [Pseudomonadota bacterium]